MNSEDEASGSEVESVQNSGSYSGGVSGLAFASPPASSSFFVNNNNEDEAPSYCFMSRASKVSPSKANYDTSDSSNYENDAKVSYNKLAKIVSIQQDQLEKQIITIKRSEELLIYEMEKNQTLTNEHSALKEKFDELSLGMIFSRLTMRNLPMNFFKGKLLMRN